MIRTPEDMTIEIRQRLMDGNGSVEVQHLFTKDELKGKCRMFAKITLAPGSSVGKHRHEGEEEVYYLLEGQATVTDNGQSRLVGPGDAILTGDGGEHSIENTGESPLVFMAVILLYN